MPDEPHDSDSPITPEPTHEELQTEFDMTPPPVPSVRRPIARSTTPNLDFLRPGEVEGEIGRLGGYRILRVLGTGGMGVVFQAEDPSLKRLVALKVMKPLLAVYDNARKRFTREAQSAAGINHNHVVRIYQVGEDQGVPYLAMELLDGEPLDTKLRREKRLSLAEALRITREVASGLAAAHRRGLVHRDIKPANIVLEPVDPTIQIERTGGDGSGVNTPTLVVTGTGTDIAASDSAPAQLRDAYSATVKIVDFGLVRATQDDADLTQSGQVTGTPQYMSPEQAEGLDVDHRSDLFSLGCVMYRMLAGETPFSGRSSSALLLAITERPHKPIRDHLPEVPRCVEEVVDRLLAKKPDDRFQSAVELMHTLAELERQIATGQALDDIAASSGPAAADSHSSMAPVAFGDLPTAAGPLDRRAKHSRLLATTFGLLAFFGLAIGWQYINGRHPTVDNAVQQSAASANPQLTAPTGASQQRGATNRSEATPQIENTTPSEQTSIIPVEEWIQGRELVTVSQDGRGMYRTISEAVVALKAGQVIKVLDKGPYRENVPYRAMPPDTGLVSVVGTRVEIGNYIPLTNQRLPNGTVPYVGWAINFGRLSGFHFHSHADLPPDAASFHVLKMTNGRKETVVDNCRVQFETLSGKRPQTGKVPSHEIHCLYLLYSGERDSSVRITECDFIGALVRMEHIQQPTLPNVEVTFDHNHLYRTLYGVGFGLGPTDYDIRHNVIDSERVAISFGLRHLHFSRQIDRLRINITNNFLVASKPLQIWGVRTPSEAGLPISTQVRIHNNAFRSADGFGISLENVDAADRAVMQSLWEISHNAYVARLSGSANLPLHKSDLECSELPLPYNADPSDENYLRIPANGRLAKSGMGGDLPSYIGPFAPGSAPDNGDWFSRLRSKWDVNTTDAPKERSKIERQAAEWALRIGGAIKLALPDGSIRTISALKDLPEGDLVVTEIDVHGNPRVNDADARRYLSGLSGLKSLEIHHTSITDLALEPLRDSATLLSLHVEATAVTDAGVAALGTMPELRFLMLNQTKVTEACLPALMIQPELRHPDIGSTPASEAAARIFLAAPRWSGLGLHESWIHPDYIGRLAEQKDCRSLSIYGDIPASRLRLLAGVPQLTYLAMMVHRAWSPELSSALSLLPQLDSLHMVQVRPSVGWKELAASRPWRSLSLDYTHLPDELFDALDRVDSLAVLSLMQTTQTRLRLQRFRADHPLVNVVSDTSRQRDRELAERLLRLGGISIHVVDQGGLHAASRLEDLPDTEFHLWSANINDCPAFDDRILASLAGLDTLRGFNLFKSGVTDAGLTTLDQFPKLSFMGLAAEHMTPRGLHTIARLPRLEGLSLPTCSVEQVLLLAPLKLKQFGFADLAEEASMGVLEHVAKQFPDLATLGIGRLNLNARTADILLKLARLESLQTRSEMLSPDIVTILARHPSLQNLDLYGTSQNQWASLAPLNRIKSLLIGVNRFSDVHIERVSELPQLQKLVFDRLQFSPEAIAAFTKLRHVSQITFTDCVLSDSDWAQITAALPNCELSRNNSGTAPQPSGPR